MPALTGFLDGDFATWAKANQRKSFKVVMVAHVAGRVVGFCGLAPTADMPVSLP
jgi:L-amino acid N-acyltransferase YncA